MTDDDRLVSGKKRTEERVDNALRPRTLDEMMGQAAYRCVDQKHKTAIRRVCGKKDTP